MTEDLEQIQGKRAVVIANGDFIGILTYSGRGLVGRDPEGVQHLLPVDASNIALASAIRDTLQHSRFLSPEEYERFFDPMTNRARHEAWVESLMKRYNYKTKRALFKRMMSCEIVLRRGSIIFRPTRHEKLEGWADLGDDSAVAVPAVSTEEDLGRALREALARCT